MLKKVETETGTKDRIQLVTSDADLAAVLQSTLERTQCFSLEVLTGNVAELEPNLLQASDAVLLLIDVNPADNNQLASLRRVVGTRQKLSPVIALSESLDENAARELMRSNVSDWCPKRTVETDLLAACERALTAKSGGEFNSGAKCYAFVPAIGGTGNTMIAIQSAFLMARKTKRFQSTCLVSLDFQNAAIADYLDLAPSLQFEEIASNPERLDEQLLEVMLSRHQSGLALLAADHALRDYSEISTELVGGLLDMASIKFEHVVIDMPRVWLPWSMDVLGGCDQVFVVTEMTVPGLRQARRLADEIASQSDGKIDPSVLVNRFRGRLIGSGINSVRKSDAEQLLGENLGGFVSEDYRLVREAIDRGVPLYEIDKRNKIDKDLSEILFANDAH